MQAVAVTMFREKDVWILDVGISVYCAGDSTVL